MKQLLPLVLACLLLGGCAPTDGTSRQDGSLADSEATEEHPDLVALREAVARDPDSSAAHRRLGIALRHSGQTDETFRHLERALELAPNDIAVLLSLGIAYSAEHRLTEAESTYRKILTLEPDHAKALHNLANVAVRRGDEEQAIEFYRRATTADPEYLTAMYKLADLLRYHGRHDEAYPVYEKILAMKPANPRERIVMVESLYGMGAINLARHEYDIAEEQLAQVVRNIPNHRSAHWARAQALIQLSRDEEAQQELQSHVKILHARGEGF